VLFEHLEGILDEVSQNKSLSLAILDFVTEVAVVVLEQVEDG
jgi:hypothetical protein